MYMYNNPRRFYEDMTIYHSMHASHSESIRQTPSEGWWKVQQNRQLKEKLPQAFMQIGWMEDDFRNLATKVWANLDNPIKRYDFSKVSLISCMSPSQVALF